VRDVALLAVPFAALAYLTVVGAGVAALLSPRLPPQAQAALSPVAGAALVAAASVLLPLGAPPAALGLGVAAVGVAMTISARRRVIGALRAGAAPLVVALTAIVMAGAPSLVRGDWRVASLYGSTDAYHWSSQARAYLHEPAAAPASEHPDRLTYERSRTQHWAVAVPFGLLQLSWLSRSDPPDVYGALAALVFCLLPLVTFVVARACLGWRTRFATAGALAVAVNGALLFASHFSWQQQLAGTAFALAAAAFLRTALEPDAPWRELVLSALLAAAALSSYRLGFAPYLGALLAVVVVAYAAARRPARAELRRVARKVAAFAVLLVLAAGPSLAALGAGLPSFVSSGGFETGFKRAFPDGQIAESLGLVPRVWGLQAGWATTYSIAWLALASATALALLAAGALVLRRSRTPRADFLAAGVGLTTIGYCILLLPSFASYLSFKILSYGAPFLVLLALAPVALARRVPIPAVAGTTALALASAAIATAGAAADSRTPGALAALGRAASAVPRGAVVAVELDDPWEQAWALYYLRNERLSVDRPSFLLTAQGHPRAASSFRHRPVAYVLARSSTGDVVWRAGGFTLVARRPHSPPESRADALDFRGPLALDSLRE
jgi:hypothetical protein